MIVIGILTWNSFCVWNGLWIMHCTDDTWHHHAPRILVCHNSTSRGKTNGHRSQLLPEMKLDLLLFKRDSIYLASKHYTHALLSRSKSTCWVMGCMRVCVLNSPVPPCRTTAVELGFRPLEPQLWEYKTKQINWIQRHKHMRHRDSLSSSAVFLTQSQDCEQILFVQCDSSTGPHFWKACVWVIRRFNDGGHSFLQYKATGAWKHLQHAQ